MVVSKGMASPHERGREGNRTMKVKVAIKVNRVFWDTDGYSYKSCGIPATLGGQLVVWDVEGDSEEDCDEEAFDLTADWLSDTYGFCHNGFQGKVAWREALPPEAEIYA